MPVSMTATVDPEPVETSHAPGIRMPLAAVKSHCSP